MQVRLYEAHGRSLHRLVGAARETSLPGGESLLCGLRLARALLIEEMLPGETFGSPKAVANYLKLHFAGQGHESFAVLFLNAQHGLIAFEDLFRGTLARRPASIRARCCVVRCGTTPRPSSWRTTIHRAWSSRHERTWR